MNALKFQYNNLKKLSPRHHAIIRLAFTGMKQVDIAREVGIGQPALSCLLSSPLAQNELEKLRIETEKNLTTIDRAELQRELLEAAVDAVKQNRIIMNSEFTDIKIKARLGMHFMDRVLFGVDAEGAGERESYRDILRAISRVEGKVDGSLIEAKSETVDAE